MSNTISPNMKLVVPGVGSEAGPQWANDINSSLTIIDQHNHASGSGVQISPSGLNINADLPININNLTLLRSVRFSPQASPLGTATDLGCLYESGVDLYYNDGNGTQIQLTSGGTVNATSSGISSGTNTASFVSSVLVVNAAANKPANIQGGSLLLGNNVAGSKFLTLAPPNAMAANYSIVLPPSNSTGSLAFVTLDTSNNMGSSLNVDNSTLTISSNLLEVAAQGVTATQIANATITSTQIAANGVSRTNLPLVNAQQSTTINTQTINPSSINTLISFLSTAITTTGRPVILGLASNQTGSGGTIKSPLIQLTGSNGVVATFNLGINGSPSGTTTWELTCAGTTSGSVVYRIPVSSISTVLVPTAGTYTYTLYITTDANTTAAVSGLTLYAYELMGA